MLVGSFFSFVGTDPVLAETWSDTTGKFNVEAEFVGVSGKDVMLRKADGKQLTVPISMLSEKSRLQAKQLYEKSKASSAPGGNQSSKAVAASGATASTYKPKSRQLKFTPPTPPPIPEGAPFPSNAPLKETVDHIRDQAMAGHLEVFWHAFPDDLRAAIDSSEIREAIRPQIEEYSKSNGDLTQAIDKVIQLLVTKKPFILKSPMLAQVPPQFVPMIKQGYDPAVGLVYEYANLASATESMLDSKTTDVIDYHMPRIGAHLHALVKMVPAELINPYLNGIVVEQTSEGTGTITLPKNDGGTITMEMVRYHDRWLTKEFVGKWEAEKDTLIQDAIDNIASGGLDPANSEEMKAKVSGMAAQVSGMLEPLLAASNQQEFDLATSQVLMPLMMMWGGPGGAGGPGAAPGPPPVFQPRPFN